MTHGCCPRPGSSTGPMQHLAATGVTVLVKTTKAQPPFKMLITDPKQDLDVSAHIANWGTIEGGITQVSGASADCCNPGNLHGHDCIIDP